MPPVQIYVYSLPSVLPGDNCGTNMSMQGGGKRIKKDKEEE
jgi:hypothetical protein